jgi:hypothetical protein
MLIAEGLNHQKSMPLSADEATASRGDPRTGELFAMGWQRHHLLFRSRKTNITGWKDPGWLMIADAPLFPVRNSTLTLKGWKIEFFANVVRRCNAAPA